MAEMTFYDQHNVEHVVLNVFYNEEYNKVYALYAARNKPTTFFIAYVNNNNGKYEFLDIEDKIEFEKIKQLFLNLVDITVDSIQNNTI